MQQEKLHIERNTIQETLVIPLFARKLCTRLYPSIYQDPASAELVKRLDYDFTSLEKEASSLVQRFGALEVAMRQTDLTTEIQDYLTMHPRAAVVNLGCGLDQTGESVDNGLCSIYNIDLPDVMAVRRQLIPAGERVTNIACDLKDPAWMEQVDGSRGAVFFAAGVFYYFQAEEVHQLVNRMAEMFPGGKLVLDTAGKTALKMMLKTVIKQARIENIGAYFHVDSMEKDVVSWLRGAKASRRGYMLGYQDLKLPCVPAFFRLLSHIGDRCLKMQILRLDFDKV